MRVYTSMQNMFIYYIKKKSMYFLSLRTTFDSISLLFARKWLIIDMATVETE